MLKIDKTISQTVCFLTVKLVRAIELTINNCPRYEFLTLYVHLARDYGTLTRYEFIKSIKEPEERSLSKLKLEDNKSKNTQHLP